jgi:hypothetical protein
MPGLDGHQPAEPRTKDENGPYPQRSAGGKEHHAGPARGVSVKNPELFPVRQCRQICCEHPDQPKDDDDPAVGAILAPARAQVAVGKQRYPGKRKKHDRERGQSRVGEEGGGPAPSRVSPDRDRRVPGTISIIARSTSPLIPSTARGH